MKSVEETKWIQAGETAYSVVFLRDSVLSGFTREVQSPRILPQLNLLVTFVRTKLNVLTRTLYREHFKSNAGRKEGQE